MPSGVQICSEELTYQDRFHRRILRRQGLLHTFRPRTSPSAVPRDWQVNQMFDRLRAEEILGKAAHSISALEFCHVAARYLVVDGHLLSSPDRAPMTHDRGVRPLQVRDATLTTTGPAWRYALSTFGDSGELNGCLVLYASTAPNPTQMIELRATARTTAPGPAEETAGAHQQEHTALLPMPATGTIACVSSRRRYCSSKPEPRSRTPWMALSPPPSDKRRRGSPLSRKCCQC